MKLNGPFFKRSEFAISAVLALLILAWNLKNSFEFGRLAWVPTYDDISYFNDALLRYQKFITGNVFSLIHDAFSNPPHSPVITFQAIISYILFGVQDWIPYVSLVWIPFWVLLLTVSYARHAGNGKWILLIYIATTPLLNASVVEFRPDIGNGILTTLAIVFSIYTITENKQILFTPTLLAAGFLLGGALLLKPTAAIYTVALLGFAVLTTLVGLRLTREASVVSGVKSGLLILLIGFILSLPYYLASGKEIIEYTYNALIRDKKIWAVNLSTLDHALYYLVGKGGNFMLGAHLWISVASFPLLLVFRGKLSSKAKLRFYVLISTTVFGYLVVAANSVKSYFIGVVFQALLVCVSFLIFCELMRLYSGRKAYWPAVSALFLITIVSIQPVRFWRQHDPVIEQEVRETVTQVNKAVRSIVSINNKPNEVYIMFSGFLNVDVITYDLLQWGIQDTRFDDLFWTPYEEDPLVIASRALERSDVVIAATRWARVAQSRLPSTTILPSTLSLVEKNPAFVLFRSIPSGQGLIHIYARKSIVGN